MTTLTLSKMGTLKLLHLLSITLTFTIITGVAMGSPPAIKAAYWPSWSESFPPSSIDTSLFTHVYYAFVSPNNATFKFEIPDSTAVLLLNFTTTLHHKTPPVKTLLSIGGASSNGDSQVYARMVSRSESRKTFIYSAIEVARKFGFDGLDIDWESPSNPKEMKDLGQLFKEWRKEIQYEARTTNQPPLLLTAATYFSVELWDDVTRKYPVDSIRKNLDWICAMCYDYHGAWDPSATGHLGGLYDPSSNISTSFGLRSWIKAGMPKSKVVMGLPLYGRTWQLQDPNINGIGAPGVAPGPGDGVRTYAQVLKFNRENGATVVYDLETVSVYSHAGSSWIGYDDALSITTKLAFAQALGIRGYFFWAVSFDHEWEISRQDKLPGLGWLMNDVCL